MRNIVKKLVVGAAVLSLSLSLFAEKAAKPAEPTQAAASGPSKDVAEAYFKRLFGYDPGIEVRVIGIAPSAIADLSEVTVMLITPDGQQAGRWFVSKDLQHAIVGDMVPFGADPFAADRTKLAAGNSGPSKGPADAKMLIVEFADLECPACKAAAPIMEKLREDFPKARFVFQSFPLPMHPWAMRAASYLDCIGRVNQDQAFTFMDSVFSHQKEIEDAVRKTDATGTSSVDDATVAGQLSHYAETAGADPAKTAACAATPETSERILRSEALAKELGVNSTPTLFLNGRRVQAPREEQYEQLKSVVSYESDEAAAGK